MFTVCLRSNAMLKPCEGPAGEVRTTAGDVDIASNRVAYQSYICFKHSGVCNDVPDSTSSTSVANVLPITYLQRCVAQRLQVASNQP